jgi:hypothetical protein
MGWGQTGISDTLTNELKEKKKKEIGGQSKSAVK